MEFNYINSNKFKNNAYLIAIPVSTEKTTELNILTQVLKRGSENFRNQALLNKELQDMYGATIDLAVSKRGDRTLLIFYGTYLKKRFTFSKEDLFLRSINLLHEILYKPLMKDGYFLKETVEIEKENLRRFLLSEYDDKKVYSNNKALEVLIGGALGIPEYGRLDDLSGIDEKNITELYKSILQEKSITYFSGDDNPEDYKNHLVEKLPFLKNGSFKEEVVRHPDNNFKGNFTEKMDVNQAKVTMLFNMNSDIKKEKFFSGLVFNSMFGGGSTSLLFSEIREKRSLCYYIMSGADFFSGILTVVMGVDDSKVEEAKELSLKYLEDFKIGKFEDEKMDIAKKNILKAKKQVEDSQFSTSMARITSFIYDYDNSYEEAVQRLNEIGRKDVVEFAKAISYIGSYTVMKGEN